MDMFETVNTGGGRPGGIRVLPGLIAGCVGLLAFAGCGLVPKPPAPSPGAAAPTPAPAQVDTTAEIRRISDEAGLAAADVTFPSNR